MQTVSLRNECQRSDVLLCHSVIPCLATTTELFHSFRSPPAFFRTLERTLTPKFAISFLTPRTLKRVPIITGIPFRTITLSEGEACWLGFPFLNASFLSEFLFPRNSVVVSWTVANPLLFLCVLAYTLDRVPFHTYLLENIDLLLSIGRNIHCFFSFALRLALGSSST